MEHLHGLLGAGVGRAKRYAVSQSRFDVSAEELTANAYSLASAKTWVFYLDTTVMNTSPINVIFFTGDDVRFCNIYFLTTLELRIEWINGLPDRLQYTSTSAISKGVNFITLEYDGLEASNSMTLTINGVDEAITRTRDDSIAATVAASKEMTLGAQNRPIAGANFFYTGLFAECQLVDRVLTAGELTDVHDANTAYGVLADSEFYFALDLDKTEGDVGTLAGVPSFSFTNSGGNIWVPFTR